MEDRPVVGRNNRVVGDPSPFDLYIGVDWSGASPARGIAIAVATPVDGRVTLVAPPGRHWTRHQAVDWLTDRLITAAGAGHRALVGIDCAFALPYVPPLGYLDGRVPAVTDLFGLWDLVEAAALAGGEGAADFCGSPALLDARFRPSFWLAGRRPPHWSEAADGGKRRRVERVAAQTGAGNPVSVFNLAAASKQVGKGSLAGMRALRHLKARLGDGLAVWPAERPMVAPDERGSSVVLEIFPTLFRRQASGLPKIRDQATLVAALARFGARFGGWCGCHAGPGGLVAFDDHAGDAMIAAAGMMRLAMVPAAWTPAGLDADVARREGWIFGVGVDAVWGSG